MRRSRILLGLLLLLIIVGAVLFFNFRSQPNSDSTAAKQSDLEIASNALSVERMISFLEKLTAINPHGGWRGSATEGEALAFDLVESELNKLEWLKSQGMTVERESFHVFLSAQDHTSNVVLHAGDITLTVPADSTRGSRDIVDAAIRMDSDGSLVDNESDPIKVNGEVVTIANLAALDELVGTNQEEKILLVDYELVDTGLQSGNSAKPVAQKLLELQPEAIVLITQYSNTVGESHGTFMGDGGGGFQPITGFETIPLVFIELENLAPLGISSWDQLKSITKAEVEWDVDVMNPATSGNLLVHIPGKAGGKPVLLSAHLDSAHSPGALDDGSGSAILMEIATLLDDQKITPTVDLYLVWYGSEELGLYGSTYFTTTHSELISDLQANIQIDCLTRPLDGLTGNINLSFSHYVSPSVNVEPLAQYLMNQGSAMDEEVDVSYWPFSSDNGSLTAFNIPNLNMIYESESMSKTFAGVWYSGHLHDPYDTVNLVREMKEVYESMAKLALSGVFVPVEEQKFVDQNYDKKVVFLANHTESPHMTPAGFPEFSLAFIEAGYQIQVEPFGSPVSASSIEGADLVVVLPTYDYPLGDDGMNVYDTSWSVEEANILDAYAQCGGTVLVVNSGYRLKLYNRMYDTNEDWADLNTLTDFWGVHFTEVGTTASEASVNIEGTTIQLNLNSKNDVVFSAPTGTLLAGNSEEAYLALVNVGQGRVVVIGDLTALGETNAGLVNTDFVHYLTKLD